VLVEQIFSLLGGLDLIAVSIVSVHWQKILEDDKIWQALYFRQGWKLPSGKKIPGFRRGV